MTIFSRISRWFSIREKLLIAFVGLSAIPLAIVGVHGIISNVQMMEQIAIENLTHDVHTIREKTANFLANVEQDLNVFRNSSLLQEFVNVSETPSAGPSAERVLRQLTAELLAFAQTKKIYYQIRMLDRRGDEFFRIETEHDANGSPARPQSGGRTYRVVPATQAHHIRENYYFFLIEELEPAQIACVPVELRYGERGQIAAISFVMPIVTTRGVAAILIANVFAEELFKVLEPAGRFAEDGTVVLVNGEGHYVYHSQKKNKWDLLLASRDEDNLQHDFPSNVVSQLVSGEKGTLAVGNQIISYAPLFPFQSPSITEETGAGLAVSLFLFESVSRDLVMKPVYTLAWTYTGFLVFFLVTAVGLGLLATRQFTKPIERLQMGADIISEGSYSHRINIQTGDEIEKLARKFNAMAASLEQHEEEIHLHRVRLEELVRQRTQELEEEKNKLQVILDNVPSALILLDKNLRIQSVSAAYESITKNLSREVRGTACNLCAEFGVPPEECPSRKALVSGRVEILFVKRNDADTCYEHIAVPIKRNGDVEAVLEIITDVTERKKFQDQLVRAERASAVGEMAAVIAHEVRNSLTSIKLILQYVSESEKLRGRKEKDSLKVAMNSSYRLESIVSDLLNFARPQEMHFGLYDVNQIVKESIIFARHQFERKRIKLVENYSPSLLTLAADAASLKEVVVNLLLNATEAVAEGAGNVTVTTDTLELSETIRESVAGSHASSQRGDVVELKRGQKVVVIEISDNGSGIPREILARIFDPFFTTKTDGTGLGLTMARRVVNEHGGAILVESQEGRGSAFKIVLPVGVEQG